MMMVVEKEKEKESRTNPFKLCRLSRDRSAFPHDGAYDGWYDDEEEEEEKKSIYESVPRGGLHIYQKSFPL